MPSSVARRAAAIERAPLRRRGAGVGRQHALAQPTQLGRRGLPPHRAQRLRLQREEAVQGGLEVDQLLDQNVLPVGGTGSGQVVCIEDFEPFNELSFGHAGVVSHS